MCIWDIPALIALLAVAVAFPVRCNKLKKTREELENELKSKKD